MKRLNSNSKEIIFNLLHTKNKANEEDIALSNLLVQHFNKFQQLLTEHPIGVGSLHDVIKYYILVSKDLVKNGQASEAIDLLIALEASIQENEGELSIPIYYELHELFMQKEQYKEAHDWLLKAVVSKDVMYKQKEQRELHALNTKFNLRKRERKYYSVVFDKKLKEEEVFELEQSALKTQLNPHFLFNALHAIQRYILKQNKKIASDYLAKFSKLIRLTFQSNIKELISLQDECELLKNYLELECLRFDFNFTYAFTIHKGIAGDTQKIPSFLLQPFVENAVLHGVSNIENGEIAILFRPSFSGLFVHIIDNGQGRKSSVHRKDKRHDQSMALKILRNRCELLAEHGAFKINLKFFDRSKINDTSSGTHVTLLIELTGTNSAIKNTKYD